MALRSWFSCNSRCSQAISYRRANLYCSSSRWRLSSMSIRYQAAIHNIARHKQALPMLRSLLLRLRFAKLVQQLIKSGLKVIIAISDWVFNTTLALADLFAEFSLVVADVFDFLKEFLKFLVDMIFEKRYAGGTMVIDKALVLKFYFVKRKNIRAPNESINSKCYHKAIPNYLLGLYYKEPKPLASKTSAHKDNQNSSVSRTISKLLRDESVYLRRSGSKHFCLLCISQ